MLYILFQTDWNDKRYTAMILHCFTGCYLIWESDKVKEIDSDIVYLTDITADNTDAMESTFKGDSLNEGTE